MISVGFVLMAMQCTPFGCDYQPLDGEITTQQVCTLDKVMMVLADPRFILQCAEVHRNKDEIHGTTDRYFRPDIG